jgi:alpha-mannosidase
MITVHMIGNAHLDPVWLWQRAEGIDTVLATARSACDRLDECPEFIFTCSASWFYETVEQIDPQLFERIRGFVRAGRWQPVGGMVIQPDCNLPSAESFARQLAVGQAYYRRAFGRPTTVGYNVDSFGHTAYLPRFLRQAGIDSYVFMRPAAHEKTLPANLFRWRSPDGHEVTTFRLTGPYNASVPDLRPHIEKTLADMPPNTDHTMCFYGVGDHGGGPTRAQIEWLRANPGAIPGARLIFSHPRAFFDAVAGSIEGLPVVEGELQHHAIGCYAVERRIKVAMRRAEARLAQADRAAEILADAARPQDRADMDRAAAAILFNQFHDMLGGTCLEESNAAVAGELIAAETAADDCLARLTRRTFRPEAVPGEHKVVLFNPSPQPFDGLVAHEPYGAPKPCALIDEQGRPVPFQAIDPRAKYAWTQRLLFRIEIPAGGRRILRVVKGEAQTEKPAAPAPPALGRDSIGIAGWTISLDVHDDPSDTWSHSCINRFSDALLGRFEFAGGWQSVESGPIRWAERGTGTFGNSRAHLRAMTVQGEPMLRLHLAVVWAESLKRLSLRIAAPGKLAKRMDLVSGGPLERPLDGLEYPLSGGLVVCGAKGSLAVIAPEVFSVNADTQGLGLTLLRSPYVAHHDPFPARERPDHPVTDQGRHEFDLLLWPGCPLDLAEPDRLARQMEMPPVVWDLTG